MQINNIIFGKAEITEPVIVDILTSKYMQRLKHISTHGFYPGHPIDTTKFNRYEHSIGVFMLLRKFNATLEEQIAGLIHDISHSAFSHIIDYIDKTNKESQKLHDHQDSIHDGFVNKTDIPEILRKYNLDVNYILNEKNFPLLENKLPDICADRIEYGVRESLISGVITRKEADTIINGLTIHNREFCFKDEESAKLFSETFWTCDSLYLSGLISAVMFCTSAKLIRKMLQKNYLTYEDLYEKSDKDIVKLFEKESKHDQEIKDVLDNLQLPADHFDGNNLEKGEHLYLKVRKINPKILSSGNSLIQYSDISPVYNAMFKNAPKYNEYFLSVKK
ncbi:MAG: HD domain-containing protein [Proteobacteria bacterium]|nr:HD domain-containing protein [Pseudomonadota bacterium]